MDDAFAISNHITSSSLELSETMLAKATGFIDVRDGLENLVEIGDNLVMPADLKSPTHSDIDRAPEGFLKKFGGGCNLK